MLGISLRIVQANRIIPSRTARSLDRNRKSDKGASVEKMSETDYLRINAWSGDGFPFFV